MKRWRGLRAVYGREMRSYFTSPIAYVVLVVFLVLTGVFFMSIVRDYVSFDAYLRERLLAMGQQAQPANLQTYLVRRVLSSLAALTLFALDQDRGTVMVRLGKGKKDRVVPIGERALLWVEKYLREVRPRLAMEPDEGHLFLGGLHVFRGSYREFVLRQRPASAG